ncbi:MAG: hypothetical protein GY847_23640 [Proteobacteria bacterium]|nr:hypothetical protein [Pseudomonadota bacterium]
MTKNRLEEGSEPAYQVEALLGLPARNLESRIKQLEGEIKQRRQISQDTLLVLGTQKLRLEDRLFRLRYSATPGDPFALDRTLGQQSARLDESVQNERTDCFRDVIRLRERLQEAREELAFEKQKHVLLKSQTRDDKSQDSLPTANQNGSN